MSNHDEALALAKAWTDDRVLPSASDADLVGRAVLALADENQRLQAAVDQMQDVVDGAWASYADLGALSLQVGDVIDDDDVILYEWHVNALSKPLRAYRLARLARLVAKAGEG